MELLFLTLDEVLDIHSSQLERYGGSPGLRDLGLLQSALAMPQAAVDQELLHEDPSAMAAAYLYHLSRNHPFVDGNKRTALMAALTFLDMNEIELAVDAEELYTVVMRTAEGMMGKDALADRFRAWMVTQG